MRIEIKVAFEVESVEGEEMTENQAWSAADLAWWNYSALTRNGEDVVELIQVHVDGFGPVTVKIAEG